MDIPASTSVSRKASVQRADQLRKSKTYALFILFISLLATVALWYSFAKVEREELETEFNARFEQTLTAINARMKGYEVILRGAVGLMRASNHVSRDEWRVYVEALKLQERYPGIQGVGFAKRTVPHELDKLIRSVRLEGYPQFSIQPEGRREEYYPIIYLEPFNEQNRRAFGYDMFSEPIRRKAMERARDTNQMAMTDKIRLVLETDDAPQAGVLMYVPFFSIPAGTKSVEWRRRNIAGFIYSPFRMNDLMHGILGNGSPDIDLEIYSGTTVTSDALLYNSASGAGDGRRSAVSFTRMKQLELGGTVWTVRVKALPAFIQNQKKRYAAISLFVGGGVSLLLAGVAWSLFSIGVRSQRLAAEMTSALRESEQRLTYVLDATEEGIWDWHLDTGLVSHNQRWCAMLGLDSSLIEHPVEKFKELIHDADRESVMRLIKDSLEKGGSYVSEHRLRRSDGTYLWVQDRGKLVERDAGGAPLRMVGSMVDISRRKHLEKLLIEEAKRYELLMETASDGIYVLDVNGALIQSNRTFRDLLGYSPEEVAKLNVRDWDEQFASGDLNRIIRDAIVHTRMFTTQHRCKDGSMVDVEVNACGLDMGLNKYLYCAARNITRRLEAEKALRESEARWHFAIDGSDMGLWDWNAATNKVFFSPRWKSMLGYAESDVGDDLSEWDMRVHPDDKAACYADLERHFRGETTIYENEHRVLCKDGTYKWILDRGKVIEWQEDGKPLRVIGTHMDITERKLIMEQLHKAKTEAEEATKLKDKFVSLVSHDLKNPISSVRGFLDLVLDERNALSRDETQTFLRHALDASGRMLTLIEDLLDISRIKSGQLRPNISSVDLYAIAVNAVFAYSHFAADKQVAVKNDISPNATLQADHQLLEEVLKNLISNALKFCRKGGRVRIYQPSPETIAVEDTGIGIRPAVMHDLFNYEVKTSTPGTGGEIGTGFGLPLCKDIMKAHGGDLRVESVEGKGSVFYLSFPS